MTKTQNPRKLGQIARKIQHIKTLNLTKLSLDPRIVFIVYLSLENPKWDEINYYGNLRDRASILIQKLFSKFECKNPKMGVKATDLNLESCRHRVPESRPVNLL